MPDVANTVRLEIPSGVAQQDIWELEEHLKRIEGVTTDLREPRDISAVAMLILQFAIPTMGAISAAYGAGKAIHDIAKIIYDFLHRSRKEPAQANKGHHVVLLLKEDEKIELDDLSIEEIEQLLKEK